MAKRVLLFVTVNFLAVEVRIAALLEMRQG